MVHIYVTYAYIHTYTYVYIHVHHVYICNIWNIYIHLSVCIYMCGYVSIYLILRGHSTCECVGCTIACLQLCICIYVCIHI